MPVLEVNINHAGYDKEEAQINHIHFKVHAGERVGEEQPTGPFSLIPL